MSAFSVFKSREKENQALQNGEIAHTPSDPKKTSKSSLKSESKLKDSIRKSVRRKSKKEQKHHEVDLKRSESKRMKRPVFERNNWVESVEHLNSSCLEEEFLPQVAQQRKQQKELHSSFTPSQSMAELTTQSMVDLAQSPKTNIKRKRPSSMHNDTSSSPPCAGGKVQKMSSSFKTAASGTKECEDSNVLETSAEELFNSIISPIQSDRFFREVWQSKPLCVKRNKPTYNNRWFSTQEFDAILKTRNVQFTRNLDVAMYRNGKRETLNPDGRAFQPLVWKFYEQGCSLRLLNPQTFSQSVFKLSSRLQEFFGCFVGSNVYLTPPGSQGFAPHYDDIEAFLIQLEGQKHWKLYAPKDKNEELARKSSANLSESDLGVQILDKVLEAGDMLYIPRGMVHQASTFEDQHSLHITLSVYQRSTYADLLEKLIPQALEKAITEDVEFRRALPLNYPSFTGISNSQKENSREDFTKNIEKLLKKLVSYADVDEAADELTLDHLDEQLPPVYTQDDMQSSVFGNSASWKDGRVTGHSDVVLSTELRLIRPGIARIVPEEEGVCVYSTVENSRQYKECPARSIKFPLEEADIVEYFLCSHPNYVKVVEAPGDDHKVKMTIAETLYNAGLLRSNVPLSQDSYV